MPYKLLTAALAGALFLSACGIKGSLYLPERPAAPAAGADHSKNDTPETQPQ
ncbi:LPS translocon maturation chaperone LptM [Pseudothauera rhizosphaerae]|uniref:Lipoprotein-attachment site-containing protein n=1 Tax=Pseudothauera rhizosphaerae TaxID=2565932 RepID=A0A4S4AL82_9RHOO|nr:lipoprotein [Pseudothauera rhizosphaerae]THF60218.1 hypothetical protein E6O51_14955 [Pseudothauera rhizosphaerae]